MQLDIQQTGFTDNTDAIKFIREQVFMKEQKVPEELEWDGLDDDAIHLLVMGDGQPVATARMLNDGHIGRMAVISSYRKQGIGSRMLSTFIDIARHKGLSKVFLSAQVEAIDFYRKHGFTVNGDTYMDAGIPHRDMYLML